MERRVQATSWLLSGATAAACLAYDPSAPALAAKRVALALVGLIALALALPRLREQAGARLSPGLLAWLLLCGVAASSLAWSPHPTPLALTAWFAAAAIGIAASVSSPVARRMTTGRTALLLVAGSSLVAIWQALRGTVAHGWHGNPNWLGLVLACGLPLVIQYGAKQAAPAERKLIAGVVVAALISLALSRSYTAIIALAGGAIVASGRAHAKALAGGLALVLAAGAGIGGRFEALEGRLWLWQVSLDWASQAPILGHGLGTFPGGFRETQATLLTAYTPDEAALQTLNALTAHQDWIQLWGENGALALVLFGGMLVVAWRSAAHHSGARAFLLVLALSACGDAPLRLAPVVVLLALVLAQRGTEAPLVSSADHPSWPTRHSGALGIALAGLIVLALAALLPRSLTTWWAHRLHSHALQADLVERAATLDRATALAPEDGEISLSLGLTELQLRRPAKALIWLERAQRNLGDVATLIALGTAYLEVGSLERATAVLRRATYLAPGRFQARLQLTEALRRQGRLAAAAEQLAIARDLRPHEPKLRQLSEALRRSQIEAATQ